VVSGLLRTNDYETVAQCLSFLSVLADNYVLQQKELKSVINKKILILLLKTVAKSPEVEYVHYTVSIVSHCLSDSELRGVILNEILIPEA